MKLIFCAAGITALLLQLKIPDNFSNLMFDLFLIPMIIAFFTVSLGLDDKAEQAKLYIYIYRAGAFGAWIILLTI